MEQKKKASSYLDELGSGYDAEGYDKEQEGKAHQEEVAAENNWGKDKRDAIGRAASLAAKKKIVARKLRRIAAELESLSKEEECMDGDYKGSIENMQSEIEESQMDEDIKEEKQEADTQDSGDLPEDLTKMTDDEIEEAMMSSDDMESEIAKIDKTDPMAVEMGTDPAFMEVISSLKVKAEHPIKHDPSHDDPNANASSQLGDEEWIDIGPGTFDDPRNAIGKAAKVR